MSAQISIRTLGGGIWYPADYDSKRFNKLISFHVSNVEICSKSVRELAQKIDEIIEKANEEYSKSGAKTVVVGDIKVSGFDSRSLTASRCYFCAYVTEKPAYLAFTNTKTGLKVEVMEYKLHDLLLHGYAGMGVDLRQFCQALFSSHVGQPRAAKRRIFIGSRKGKSGPI